MHAMSDNPYESPETPGEPAAQDPVWRRFRLIELLVVVGVIGLLIALLLPNVRMAREPARRGMCSNNLKQIAIALHNYESEYGCLPPAYTVDAAGKPLHSWRTLILPFNEQKPLYDKIDLSKPWDDPANKIAFETRLPTYRCPSGDVPEGHTTYLAVAAPGGCFQGAEPRKLAEITDSHDRTMIVIEVSAEHAVHWMSPSDATAELILNRAAEDKPSHPSGSHAVSVSGYVTFLPASTPPDTLRALISIAGSDDDVAQAAD
jgi:type II secretory pathway pseudopilin PulG